MNYLLWWFYEGRSSAIIKNLATGLRNRIEGGKQRRAIRRELLKNPMPKYKLPEEYKSLL